MINKKIQHLPEIHFKTIAHKDHRYPTVGDYWDDKTVVEFRVSNMDSDKEFLVLIHELVEWFMTLRRGLLEPDIKKFDLLFEKERDQKKHSYTDEAGDDPRAPYYKEHQFATAIERLVCDRLGVDWNDYTKEVENL